METLHSWFPQLFLSTGAKVPQERKIKSMEVVCGANVPPVRRFHGAKVLGTFVPEKRKFQGCESSMERKLFFDFSLPGSECSTERSSTGAKVLSIDFSLTGTKVQRNEKSRYRCRRCSLIATIRTFSTAIDGRSPSARLGWVLGLAGAVFRPLERARPDFRHDQKIPIFLFVYTNFIVLMISYCWYTLIQLRHG